MRFLFVLALTGAMMAQTIPQIDQVIEAAIAKGELPGAVCLVGQRDRVLHLKAYGQRAVEPAREPMTLDTIFDAASLTKVVATTSSMLRLIEDGKVRLGDRVTVYLPEFQGGKSEITVRHLLTHYSGLRPDVDLEPVWSGYETGIQKALVDKPVAEPGAKFIYSDINFILLGEIVRRVGGKPLNEFARENVFLPLGMMETGFLPDAKLLGRIAPTQKLHGVVHDPTTRFMGGVAGHAGLFTTADDLAKFARMYLRKGAPLYAPLTIAAATRPQSPAGMTALRGLGWDIDSPFAGNRGDLYPVGSFGHTGFTGTSLWIDPSTESYVILLANAIHPNGRPPITPLRGRVASAAAAYISRLGARVVNGIDRLEQEKFAGLAGKTVGLISNHTGILADGRRNIDAMLAGGVKLKALFSPEHGFSGKFDDEKVTDTRDPVSKLPVYSLYYGEKREPNPATLKGIDTLVFDIQDIGSRFYTYGCTMKNAMEVAAKLDIEFVVLDRPNPITGTRVEGPMIDAEAMSFVGCLPVPLRHGMTMGELARFANDLAPKKAKLRVVEMQNWRREMWFDETGLPWVNPSPNMKSLAAATLYTGIGMIEYAKNYSVGRGTDLPFEQVGAEWIDGAKLAARMNGVGLRGVVFTPISFVPTTSIIEGKTARGVRMILTDRNVVEPTRVGLELICALRDLFGKQIDHVGNKKLIGSLETIRRLDAGEAATVIQQTWVAPVEEFLKKRQQFLIYR